MLRASYVTQEVWFAESPTAPAGTTRRCAATSRRGPPRCAAEPLLAELDAFARCVLDGTPEPVSAHDGVRALAAALAVRESAAVRRPVTLLDIPAPRAVLEAVA